MNKSILLLVFVVFACLKSFAQPANDNCANAIAIACGGTQTGSTVTATMDVAPPCGPFTISSPGVWYTFVGTGDAITASLCGSAYDTQIFIYSGSCGSLTCIVSNDDAGAACASSGLNSIANFSSTLGTNYYILVTGFASGTGAYSLNIACVVPPVAPPNDNCTGITPTILVNGAAAVAFTGTTVNATTDALFSTIVVWEAVTLTECSNLTIDYCGTNPSVMQSALIVYTTCPATGLTSGAYDVTTCLDANVTFRFFNLPAGTYYLPVLGGSPNTPGPYIMHAQSFDCSIIGIEESTTAKSTLLYPNPASDVLNIKGVFEKGTIVTITGALGKVLLTENFNSSIDITSLPNGVYMIQIQGENYNHFERFVKAK